MRKVVNISSVLKKTNFVVNSFLNPYVNQIVQNRTEV